MVDALASVELTIQRWVNQEWHTPLLDAVMPLFSSVTLLWVVLAACLVLLLWHCFSKFRRSDERLQQLRGLFCAFLLLGGSVAATESVSFVTKHVTSRLRPFQEQAGTRYISKGKWVRREEDTPRPDKQGSSFVSAHAANTMALANALAYLYPPAKPLVYALPLSVGYSRVYLGRHYPKDVLIGWILGWVFSSVVCNAFGRLIMFNGLPGRSRGLARAQAGLN